MEQENNERKQLEWLVISALRENLSMLDENIQVDYDRTIEFAKENFSMLFRDERSVLGKRQPSNRLLERYVEEAKAKTIAEGKEITTEQLIHKRLTELVALIKNPLNKKTKLKQIKLEKFKLEKLLDGLQPMFVTYDESQALINDYTQKRPNKKYIEQIAGRYSIFKTKAGDPFVIRFLHPGKPETATGVDLIYEYHQEGKIRIIAVQYKIWEKGVLYFSQSKNLANQLNTATKCFCRGGFCDSEKSPVEADAPIYRFPCCVPYLRPTDKLQSVDNLRTSGWHIPICQIPDRLEVSKDKILRLEKIKDVALNLPQFDALFEQGMIGSRWLSESEVMDFYKKNKILESNDDKIIILSQRF